MKIAVLSSFPDKNCGLADYTYPLVQEFKKSTDIEKVVVIGDLESNKADYRVNFRSITLYKKVREIIDKESIDLLYVGHEYWIYGRTNLSFILVHYALDIPIVTLFSVITSTDPGVSLIERIRANIVEKIVSRKTTKIVVNTGIQREQLKNFPLDKTVEVPLGVYSYKKNSETEETNKKTILFFGIISAHKGIENLIKAIEYLDNVRLIIAGKPNMAIKPLLDLKERMTGTNEIILDLSWISSDKKNKYFNCADIVVLPYTRIGLQSGVLYDALSYGIPCVVSEEGMMGSVVKNNKLGQVINPFSPDDISIGINKVMKDYTIYQNNVYNYQKITSWKNVAEKYVKIFKQTFHEYVS